MNRRCELIHVRCSCSEQRGKKKKKKKKGEGRLTCDGDGLAGVKGSGGGRRWLRRRSFFFSPLLRCAVFFLCFSFSLSTRFLLPFLLTVAEGGGEERTGGGSRRALRVLGCCCGSSSSRFYSSHGFLSLGSVLFLFSLSGSASVGSADGGGMVGLLVVVVVVKWRCWMVVAEGHCGERGAAAGNPKIPPVSASFLLFFCFSSLLFGLCFLFLSPFSRLASLSVTAFSPSPKILPPLFVSLPLFISRKRRSPPCSVPSWCRGEMGCLTCAG